ncbi:MULTISPECIES: sigma-54-dependent Fis family transcriptional regulator [unclassified Thioalkalivibrio]|uniref:sigma-54 interaction domain-containing protein n=1 Tax=unclassified Thioalkalivibrio TaxID=2621013 RepID=UPI00037E0658|nr:MULTISPECIES: sigma-54 dependent transcriptional regulator [unclassified Thioalkalivibrio]
MTTTELAEICIRHSRDPHLISDTRGRVLFANPAFHQTLQIPPDTPLTLDQLGSLNLEAHLKEAAVAAGDDDADANRTPHALHFSLMAELEDETLPLEVISQPLRLNDDARALRLITLQPQRRRTTSVETVSEDGRDGLDDSHFHSHDAHCRPTLQFARRVAASDVRVMLLGESGTGKTRLARAIHQASRRAEAPFVEINCAAIPEELLESELFGHTRGAFSGAVSDRIGRFESADGGTLFLDEIGEMSQRLQAKLLRAVQDGAFERVGENTTRQVDVRILAASNQDLRSQVEAGEFRTDLFYRLAVATVDIPPLRDRPRDLAATLQAYEVHHGIRITPRLKQKLQDHPWPGNFRELENVFECLTLHARDGQVDDFPLPEPIRVEADMGDTIHAPRTNGHDDGRTASAEPNSLGANGTQASEHPEARRLRDALVAHAGNRSQTARALGMDRSTLWRKLHRYQLV